MFCPNCGTKNDDSAQKCGQCGFDLKPKGAATKHKGTVMMTGSPVAHLGTEQPKPMPNLKGTMVGVAPPDLSGALSGGAKQGASSAATRPSPNLKGTMVGVAPPGVDDLKKQAAASSVAASSAAPQPVKVPPASLKGTMIGLAPPNMGAEVEAAKAKLAAKKAEAAEARAASEGVSGGAVGANAPAVSKATPSQLKGTMIGVAPPDVQAQMAAVKKAAAARMANAPLAAQAPVQEQEPPSEPDPLGGTMVGTSPFAPGGPHAGTMGSAAQTFTGAQDFNDDTPPAGSGAPAETPEASAQGNALSAGLGVIQTPPPKVTEAPEPYSLGGQADRLPIKKSSTGPILLVVLLLLIVAAGVGFLLMGQGDTEEPAAEDATTTPAPPDASQE